MDRIDLFRVFVRVVECANFTRAAGLLGMPRSSVSAAVIELESRVGARLLHRTTRKVSPTHDGAAFYERCLRVVADVEETETLFRQGNAKPSGKLRVDLPSRIGRLIVAPALPAFLDTYPEIEIDLGARTVIVLGRDGRLDLGIDEPAPVAARRIAEIIGAEDGIGAAGARAVPRVSR